MYWTQYSLWTPDIGKATMLVPVAYMYFHGLTHGFYIRWLLISRCARMSTRSFSEKKIGFDDSFDVTKCLQQIEMPDLLHVCA